MRFPGHAIPGFDTPDHLRLETGAPADLDGAQSRAAFLFGEHRPLVAMAEQCRQRHLANIGAFPQNDPDLYLIAVAEPLPVWARTGEVDDHVDPLLFDAERSASMGRLARHVAEQCFERHMVVERYEDLYHRLLGRPGC